MIEQLTGAGISAIVVLAYVLLVQAMTAAIVLLAEFIVLRVRVLRELLAASDKPTESPTGEPYQVGGGLVRWQ
jgi:hypothetical protein